MKYAKGLVVLLALGLIVAATPWVEAKPRTGVIEKRKVDDQKLEVFTDTVYNYTLTTPPSWDFKVQKEKSDDELNPYRLRAVRKDKQVPTQLWENQSVVTPAQIMLFVVDVDLEPRAMRDSLASPTFDGEWQKPVVKECEILRDSDFLNSMDIRWENNWKGAGFSVQRPYTAQIPTGGGLFSAVSEVLLGEFYVFPFRGKRLIVHLVTEREFLEENRDVVKGLLESIGPPQG